MAIATKKVIRMDLEEREAFLLNAIYAIGLRTLAGESAEEVAGLTRAVKVILNGERGAAALFALSQKMKASALSISDADTRRMAVDP
jgi:hypothetical protein